MNVVVLSPGMMWLDDMGNGIFLVYIEIAKKKDETKNVFS